MRWLGVLRRAAARTRLVMATALVLLTVLPGAWAGRALADVPPSPNVGAQAGRLAWPLTPRPKVTRFFEPPATAYGPGHRGVDLEAAAGQQVLAADLGVVIFAGQIGGHGVVAVDHDGGLRTTYLPLTPTVVTGDQVYRGQPLGTVAAGHPGCPTATCLHWGARKGEEYIDPLALVGTPGRVRLKPWADPH
ncbi:M23 family metallopeptidase [Amycolatopsis sp. NPDC051372]|uniref:murein hydrolase activator EnvC family protein n=1 Tax=Amycolatopsis sp. NPDC051372 TaxID=3155669 RepID=UPI00342295D4